MNTHPISIVDMIDAAAKREPAKSVIEAGEDRWSYADLVAASRREASLLAGRGIARGDRIAVIGLNTPGFLIASLAIWRTGGVLVPINHKLAAPEWAYILRHCSARLAFVSAALRPLVEAAAPSLPIVELEAIEHRRGGDAAAWRDVAVSADDAAEILYTSGTTGRPKGCVHTHRGLVTVALVSGMSFSVVPQDRMLIAMPIWHAAPLNNYALPTLVAGGTLVLLREYEPEAFVRTLSEARITTYFGAPVSFTLPLGRPGGLEGFDFSTVRALMYGGGPIGAEMSARLIEAYGTDRFYQVYGMTETGPGGTLLYPDEQAAKPGSIGRSAQPGAALRLVVDGREATAGEVGEIWLRSPGLMAGYLDDPAATAAVIENGWYRTGDLARRDADGYLFIVDRARDMVITGGENVYSKEVEEALATVAGIADCAVIGVPHPDWGETVVAVVVPVSGHDVDDAGLRAALRPLLAGYKIPRRFVAVEALPRTPTGKVTKHVLRAMVDAPSPTLSTTG